MRALVYHGPRNVRVDNVPDPRIVDPTDAIVRVTRAAICGSDLHLYHGYVPELHDGDILGHEFVGVVEEVGPDVRKIRRGDRVVVPFLIACGQCFFCQRNLWAACETTNTGAGYLALRAGQRPPAAVYGYGSLYGGVPGSQAEFVRVRIADVNAFRIPGGVEDDEAVLLGDILPTGWQAALNADVREGSTVAIFGAGPVGLASAMCARFMGARTVFIVDDTRYRLDFAERHYGAIPIDFSQLDPAKAIVERTQMRGVDAAIDAVGGAAKGSNLELALALLKLGGGSGSALRECIGAVRRGGTVSAPGVYGGLLHRFPVGDLWEKGVSLRMGETHVHRYIPELLRLVEAGRLRPAEIFSHHLSLQEAARGYQMFDRHEEGCTKVVLEPQR